MQNLWWLLAELALLALKTVPSLSRLEAPLRATLLGTELDKLFGGVGDDQNVFLESNTSPSWQR